jgi:hypothetical protein
MPVEVVTWKFCILTAGVDTTVRLRLLMGIKFKMAVKTASVGETIFISRSANTTLYNEAISSFVRFSRNNKNTNNHHKITYIDTNKQINKHTDMQFMNRRMETKKTMFEFIDIVMASTVQRFVNLNGSYEQINCARSCRPCEQREICVWLSLPCQNAKSSSRNQHDVSTSTS